MHGAIRGVGSYLQSLWSYRFFWSSLVKAELQRRYRRSVLGIGWSLLHPLAMATVLCLVYQRIFNLQFREFGPFVLTGLAFWNFVSGTVLQGCQSFRIAEAYIRQHPAPLAIYPLRTVLSIGFHFLVAFGVAILFVLCVRGVPPPLALMSLVPTLVLLFLLGWALAILAAFANVYFPDVQHLSEIALQMLFFLTPIIYPPHIIGERGLGMLLYNPLAILVEMLRRPLLQGVAPELAQYAALGSFVLAAGALAALLLARLERRLIFEL
jgi:ABC-type polysaccharide/polyol phosphate export permease